jgi:hypothetical protein
MKGADKRFATILCAGAHLLQTRSATAPDDGALP